MVSFLARGVKMLSENSYRSVRTGRLNKDLDIVMKLNEAFRARNQIEYRIKFVPLNIAVDEIYHVRKDAEREAERVTEKKKFELYGGFDLEADMHDDYPLST